jgi:hypothetical protein
MVSRKKCNDVTAAALVSYHHAVYKETVSPDYQDSPDIKTPTASSVASFSDPHRYTAAMSTVGASKPRGVAGAKWLAASPFLTSSQIRDKKKPRRSGARWAVRGPEYQAILVLL